MELRDVFSRGRFFFARVTGRRRIGKTTLVQRALSASERDRLLYVQIPDSAPAGVVSAYHDAMDAFELPTESFPRPTSLISLAGSVEALIRAGYVVALDEFQYFSRKHLHEYWDKRDTEIDFVAVDDDNRRIRFGSCKRNPAALLAEPANLSGHVGRFLAHHKKYATYDRDLVGFAPEVPADLRRELTGRGLLVQDLVDLTQGLA